MDASRDIEAAGPTDPSHDGRLRRGILDTEITRGAALSMMAAFLLLIYAVPLSQALLERLDDEDSSLLPLFTRAPSKQNLHQFEHDLEQASFAKAFVQPRVQLWLSRFGRAGNQRALIGTDGFLYYSPGLTHLSGPSFLDPDAIAARERAAREAEQSAAVRADPRPAILEFRRMLARRGIALVLFPVPDKTMLQPWQLHGARAGREPVPVVHNQGFHAFARWLHAQDVILFDPSPALLQQGEQARFLIQDTHWTPAWMAQVARALAETVRRAVSLPVLRTSTPLRASAKRVERVGDLVDMLKLPEDQHWFRPQAVTIQQVQDADGALWEPDRAGDVLLLGDSFTNVFSMDTMGWGESAGLGPQLALALGRAIDVIAQNDSGAYATRLALARELAAGEDRLAGKRVVIWEFASRELSVGDWRCIDWRTGESRETAP
jgi:alginate O-acetyltransferase complex protein AlgJ